MVIASVLWWLLIPYAENQSSLRVQRKFCRRFWKLSLISLACVLLTLLGIWGIRQHFERVPAAQATNALRSALEFDHNVEWMFFLIWTSSVVQLIAVRVLARRK